MTTILLVLLLATAKNPSPPCQPIEPICGFGCVAPINRQALACFLENEVPRGPYWRCSPDDVNPKFCIPPD